MHTTVPQSGRPARSVPAWGMSLSRKLELFETKPASTLPPRFCNYWKAEFPQAVRDQCVWWRCPIAEKKNIFFCLSAATEWDQWLHTHLHTRTHTFSFERMGIPFGPVVSDLCAPITQVSQWVTTKKTVGSCGFFAQRGPHQSVTMCGCFISPFMTVSGFYPMCVCGQWEHRSDVYTLFPPSSAHVPQGPVHCFHLCNQVHGLSYLYASVQQQQQQQHGSFCPMEAYQELRSSSQTLHVFRKWPV